MKNLENLKEISFDKIGKKIGCELENYYNRYFSKDTADYTSFIDLINKAKLIETKELKNTTSYLYLSNAEINYNNDVHIIEIYILLIINNTTNEIIDEKYYMYK